MIDTPNLTDVPTVDVALDPCAPAVHGSEVNSIIRDPATPLQLRITHSLPGLEFSASVLPDPVIQNTSIRRTTSSQQDTLNPVTEHGTADPIAGGSPDPVADETPDPVVDETLDPLVDETPDPIVDETPDPVVDGTPDPVVDETHDPVAPNALNCFPQGSSDPEARATPDPVAHYAVQISPSHLTDFASQSDAIFNPLPLTREILYVLNPSRHSESCDRTTPDPLARESTLNPTGESCRDFSGHSVFAESEKDSSAETGPLLVRYPPSDLVPCRSSRNYIDLWPADTSTPQPSNYVPEPAESESRSFEVQLPNDSIIEQPIAPTISLSSSPESTVVRQSEHLENSQTGKRVVLSNLIH